MLIPLACQLEVLLSSAIQELARFALFRHGLLCQELGLQDPVRPFQSISGLPLMQSWRGLLPTILLQQDGRQQKFRNLLLCEPHQIKQSLALPRILSPLFFLDLLRAEHIVLSYLVIEGPLVPPLFSLPHRPVHPNIHQ